MRGCDLRLHGDSLVLSTFCFALIAQFAIALSGAALAPAFAAITLGIVGMQFYKFQVSRNEAYKHDGAAFSALLSFIFALYYGIASIFIITLLWELFRLFFYF